MTITLNDTQQKGMELYAIDNGYMNEDGTANVDAAIDFMITATANMMITEAYKRQQSQSKTVEEMAAEI